MLKGFCYGFSATLGVIFAIPVGISVLKVIGEYVGAGSKEEESDG